MQLLPLLRTTTPAVFCSAHFTPQTPCRFPPSHFLAQLPATKTWFTPDHNLDLAFFTQTLSERELGTMVTIEASTSATFERVSVPFIYLLQFLVAAAAAPPPFPPRLPHFYLAQSPLLELIPALQPSLPTPELVRDTGRGDVYATNVWLGRSEGIDTPLHKDPNPNLFVQLAGRKRIRMFSPEMGREMVGGEVGRFREEEEMMVGEGRRRVEEVVWGGKQEDGYEVEVGPGDGVFIPKGWWHAIRGVGEGVGCSVNWWFR